MALFRRFFYRKPPDRLLEISERVYVFDCCFSTDALDEYEYKTYMGGIVAQLQDHYPDASFMVFNFKEGDQRSQISDILTQYDMTVMDYPRRYEGCPVLPLEMIKHFLRSSESWLSLEGQQNVLLMHCERGGWPVLAFMLAGLLLYREQYTGEQKTLDMVYRQAPRELLYVLSPLNPQPSQLRYLHYITRRTIGLDWLPSDIPFALDCIILRVLPLFDGGKGCRLVVRVYGQDPASTTSNRSSKLLFSTSKTKQHGRLYRQEECALVKIDIHCRVQGDVVLECIHLEDDLVREEMIFRVMFHTAFIRSNVLMLTRDEVDVPWDAKDQFSREFKAEVLFSDADAVPSIITVEAPDEDDNETEGDSPEEFFEVEEIFSNVIDGPDGRGESDAHSVQDSMQDDDSTEIWKEELEHHAFQDSAFIDVNRKQERNADSTQQASKTNGLAHNDDLINSKAVISDVSSDKDSKAGTHGASVISEEVENKQDIEGTFRQERQGSQQKLTTDISKGKNEKAPSSLKKQLVSNSKLAVDGIGPKDKSKQKESQGTLLRLAKPNAVSRWIPSNKGSYTNSMHVAYPPSRYKSAPPVLAVTKDSQSGLKSKSSSPRASSEAKIPAGAGRVPKKHSSCPASLDMSTVKEAPVAMTSSSESVESQAYDLQESPQSPLPSSLPSFRYPSTSSLELPPIQEASNNLPDSATLPVSSLETDITTDSLSHLSPRPPGGGPPPPPLFGAKGPGAAGRGIPAGRAPILSRTRSNLKPLHWSKVTRALQGSLWEELQRHGEPQIAPEFDVSEIEVLFSATPKSSSSGKSGGRKKSAESKPDKVHLVDLRRANNTEIMLTKVKMPLPDMMAAALAMDESILDADQVENLIKFCPTKDEMDLLKGYTGDKELLGKCEQFFLELMKVPRVESKLRVFLFKIQFKSQVTDFKKSLTTVNSACEEVRNSSKLKEIMKKILFLGNTLNQGTARGSAIGFKLDSLLKLTDTRATNNKMTLMHYLCKVLASKSPALLDFHEDLVSVEAASKIQLKSLAEEMQAIIKGLEKVKKELEASENDGPVSEIFCKTLKEFIGASEAEVGSLRELYSVAGRNADALALYFNEDPAKCPFEQVTATLLNFVRLFRKAHEENLKQAELDKKKVQKEAETENAEGSNLTKKGEK
uniref:Formin-like protein n=1 Tax=Nicotiana tabacum TaxID=4097 RepID=A0A1S4B617_TOBAC|nr:PREDICTED: formin-like protein 20 [Nicotiana tabacum]